MTPPYVAVLTLTRDRLDYTKHCFQKLEEFAGCDFDHFILDQGSEDGTREWLGAWSRGKPLGDRRTFVLSEPENIGICAGLNKLLDHAFETDDYDVVVKVDNDCELTQHNTLRRIAELTLEGGCLLSPRILGLRQPPQWTRELRIGDETILDVPQIGGIFTAVPGWVYTDFRYSEPLDRDDVELCWWWRGQGGTCGYVKRFTAWHYETTDGQWARYPEYFARKTAEMEAA